MQQSITSCQQPTTGFHFIRSHQAGGKTLNNKHAEKEKICDWAQKNAKQSNIIYIAISASWWSHLRTHTHVIYISNRAYRCDLLSM